jgi:hypothetical protein
MTTQSGINLDCCVPGQKVKFRSGKIGIYDGVIDGNEIYTHSVNGYSYTRNGSWNGSFWMEAKRSSPHDIAEILPLESSQSQILTEQIDIVNPDHVTIVPGGQGVVITIKKGKSTITWHIEG